MVAQNQNLPKLTSPLTSCITLFGGPELLCLSKMILVESDILGNLYNTYFAMHTRHQIYNRIHKILTIYIYAH